MSRSAILTQAAESLRERAALNNDQHVLQWVNTLPQLTTRLLNKWGLTPEGSADNGALSSCLFVQNKKGEQLLMKIPSNPQTGNREWELISEWGKHLIAPIAESHDPESGAILMELITPGKTAEPRLYEKPVEVLTNTLQRLHSTPIRVSLPPASIFINQRLTWARERYSSQPQYSEILTYAEQIAKELLETQELLVPLHGDLQPKNLLTTTNRNSMKVIDPFGLYGEKEIDYTLWAVVQESDTTINQRIQQLSTTASLNQQRAEKWATFYSILELRPHATQYVKRIRNYLQGHEDFMELPHAAAFTTQE